ncbi:hypothetical protein F52700_3175 [Fusarium sp. NRRL 52700]|nr:hypothetical protein F52700_3175 [Fusarium sp. NRRL 52700]
MEFAFLAFLAHTGSSLMKLRLVETLQEAPAGYAFCTGCPGAGKTTTVLKAILSGSVEKVNVSDSKWNVKKGGTSSDAPADET